MSEHYRVKRPPAEIERYGPWPPPPFREDRVKLTSPWIIHEDDELLVVNKSGEVVCHPSKFGPTSSLVGAAREYTGLATMHLIFRLDRETSGVVVMAKNPSMASLLQTAMQKRKVAKSYTAFLKGHLTETITVDQPLGPDEESPVWVKDRVRSDGKTAISHFSPMAGNTDFTVARVTIETGGWVTMCWGIKFMDRMKEIIWSLSKRGGLPRWLHAWCCVDKRYIARRLISVRPGFHGCSEPPCRQI